MITKNKIIKNLEMLILSGEKKEKGERNEKSEKIEELNIEKEEDKINIPIAMIKKSPSLNKAL